MPSASQLKKGMVIEVQGQAHMVQQIIVQTPSARGAATLYKIRARNVVKGQKADLSCRGEEMFKELELERRQAQYLYKDQDRLCFMDLESYEQFELPEEMLADDAAYLVDDMEVTAMVIEGKVSAIALPDTVELTIVECEPAVKGASATARTKTATLQTGLEIQVPEHIENGDTVKVDTRDGRYLGRA